jgi:ATP dependent DNA ligase C terminal region
VVVGGLAGRGRRAGIYGALLLAVYDQAADRFQTICKCGTGFSDAELAALPAKLAPLARDARPARVDSRWAADVWFEPTLVVEVLAAELTVSPHHTAGWGLLKEDAGLALRFLRFTVAGATTRRPRTRLPSPRRWRCIAPLAGRPLAPEYDTIQPPRGGCYECRQRTSEPGLLAAFRVVSPDTEMQVHPAALKLEFVVILSPAQ